MTEEIKVTVSGAKPSGRDFTIRTKTHGGVRPNNVGPDKMRPGSARFFDVFVDGVGGEKVTVWITHNDVGRDHQIDHWDGNEWKRHNEKIVTGNTIQAEFQVADLRWTPIVIGT